MAAIWDSIPTFNTKSRPCCLYSNDRRSYTIQASLAGEIRLREIARESMFVLI